MATIDSQKRQISAYKAYLKNPSKAYTDSVKRLINRGADLSHAQRPYVSKTTIKKSTKQKPTIPTKGKKTKKHTKQIAKKPTKQPSKTPTSSLPTTGKGQPTQPIPKRNVKGQFISTKKGKKPSKKKVKSKPKKQPSKKPKQPKKTTKKVKKKHIIGKKPKVQKRVIPSMNQRSDITQYQKIIYIRDSTKLLSILTINAPSFKPTDKYVQCTVFLYYKNEKIPVIVSSYLAPKTHYDLCIKDIISKSTKGGTIVGYSVKWQYLY